ncbi:hypothetical protein U1Q18_000188, partial [Sarracenia purpurea var. burkii]
MEFVSSASTSSGFLTHLSRSPPIRNSETHFYTSKPQRPVGTLRAYARLGRTSA